MNKSEPDEHVVSVRIRNSRATPVPFVLEPWAEALVMPAGAVFLIVARGPASDTLEVEFAEECIVVYAWSGSVAQVSHDGVEITSSGTASIPVPDTPPGMDVGQFTRFMFDRPEE